MAENAEKNHIDVAAALAGDSFKELVTDALARLQKQGVGGFADVYLALVVSNGSGVCGVFMDTSQTYPADANAILADASFKSGVERAFAEMVAQEVSETESGCYLTLIASDGSTKAGAKADVNIDLSDFQQCFLTFTRGDSTVECAFAEDTSVEDLLTKAGLTLGENEQVFDGDDELDLGSGIDTEDGDRTFTIKVVENSDSDGRGDHVDNAPHSGH